ncbi:cupin domain-containing protein [Clostridium botulinum]|uniref:Cupin domain-containing protein n=1 Tax=Clostridium botulinum TaxID=1491 RepID=A0A6M0SQ73_CLOBO|nr:cupin domain-containing protein [Clostridium botulinum]
MRKYIVNNSEVEYLESQRGGKIKMLANPKNLNTKSQVMGMGVLEFGEENKLHIHDYSEEIFYITKGNGEVVIHTKKYVINEGDIILIPNGIEHKLINNSCKQLEYIFSISPLAPTPEQGHRDL